jgi:hypothetical protein
MKKFTLGFLAAAASLSALLSSCEKDTIPTIVDVTYPNLLDCKDGTSYFPFIKEGNRITYKYTFFVDPNDLHPRDTVETIIKVYDKGLFSFRHKPLTNNHPMFLKLEEKFAAACSDNIYSLASDTSTIPQYPYRKKAYATGETFIGQDWSVYGKYRTLGFNATAYTAGGPVTACTLIGYTPYLGTSDTLANWTDTLYWRSDIGTVMYKGVLYNYEMLSKNF